MRTMVVRAYVTEAEYQAFHHIAHRRQVTLSQHIRNVLLLDAESAGVRIPESTLIQTWSQEALAFPQISENEAE